jgi:dTDP-4-dehydrorhamnose reductase
MNEGSIRIAVTGANGQLGQELRWLAPLFKDFEFCFFAKADWDIAIESQNVERLSNWKPHVVINAAAYTNVEKAEDDIEGAMAANALGPGYLAEACKEHGALVIHISTDYVFDGAKKVAYSEEDPVHPLNIYGKSKLEGERAIDAVTDRYFIFRTSWLYSTFGHNFYKTMLRLGRERDSVYVVNDQLASPTYARFLAEDLLQLIRLKFIEKKSIPFGIYHYTQLNECTWFDFATEIMRVNGMATQVHPVSSDEFPTKARRPAYSKLSTQRWSAHIGIELRTWQDGVKACSLDF